jgi:mannose/cellobiose epimerase-like protein (N-acyl-D-glucosamine 2-epimerase family)
MRDKILQLIIETIIQGCISSINKVSLNLMTNSAEWVLHKNAGTIIKRIEKQKYGWSHFGWNNELVSEYCLARIVTPISKTSENETHTLLTLLCFGKAGSSPIEDHTFHIAVSGGLAEFWLCALDYENGGVFANILNGGVRDPAPSGVEKWSAMTSRNVAGFSFAFLLTGQRRFLYAAKHGMIFLKDHSRDTIHSKAVFRGHQKRDGSLFEDSLQLVNIFEQEYSLTGPLRYLAITNDNDARVVVEQGLDALAEFHDSQNGGFYDALLRSSLKPDKGKTDTKSFTSSADLMASVLIFASELEVKAITLDPSKAIQELVEIILDRHLVGGRPFIIESLNADWTPNTSMWRNHYATPDVAGNIGATAKVSRMLASALPLLKGKIRKRASEASLEILRNLLSIGAWDDERGGVFDVMLRNARNREPGELIWHANYVWWSQEQLCVAAYLGYLLSENDKYLTVARSILRFWYGCFLSESGGVYDTVDHAGHPVSTHMGRYVKNSLHEIELCYFAAVFESIITNSSLTIYFPEAFTGDYRQALPRLPGISWKIEHKVNRGDGTIAVNLSTIRSNV